MNKYMKPLPLGSWKLPARRVSISSSNKRIPLIVGTRISLVQGTRFVQMKGHFTDGKTELKQVKSTLPGVMAWPEVVELD